MKAADNVMSEFSVLPKSPRTVMFWGWINRMLTWIKDDLKVIQILLF